MVEPARVCAISCVVEGKLTVSSARVIYRLSALCDSRGLRSPTVCYPLTASALELFPTHHTTRGRGEGPSLFTAIYLSNEIRARHVAMRHAIGRVQAWEGGHAYAVFQLFVRTQPRQTVVSANTT
jgi:hypothetical protein